MATLTSDNSISLEDILSRIAVSAAERDENPDFPTEAFRDLGSNGALAMPAPDTPTDSARRASFAEEWRVLRAVARADGSVGRIFDGHLNAVERISALAPEPLRSRELEGVASREMILGVWGADPIPGEGPPARLSPDGNSISGVKTWCSGSTGVQRALVLVRSTDNKPGPPHLAYVDTTTGMYVDRSWFKGAGMRTSESHRVVFEDAPVLAVLGEPGELLREPYFARDAIRTAVTWAGMCDSAVDATLAILAAKSGDREPDDLVSLAAGRILTAQGTIDRWLEYAATEADGNPNASLAPFATQLRESVARSCREVLDEAARAVGSHPFAVAGRLDLARRNLELFLLQHRLEPAVTRRGRKAILDAGRTP